MHIIGIIIMKKRICLLKQILFYVGYYGVYSNSIS